MTIGAMSIVKTMYIVVTTPHTDCHLNYDNPKLQVMCLRGGHCKVPMDSEVGRGSQPHSATISIFQYDGRFRSLSTR